MVSMAAGARCLHYIWHHKHDGIVFSSDGNHEPICFYDSSHNQNGDTFKNQYGFIIFWMGGPILWASKDHKHAGSVQQRTDTCKIQKYSIGSYPVLLRTRIILLIVFLFFKKST